MLSVMAGAAPEGSQFDAKTTNELVGADVVECFTCFDAMGLQENLLKGIQDYGFEKPSIVQQRAIVPFCKGNNVILQAQYGSGKITSLCTGILQRLDYNVVSCQALVLTPTLEHMRQTKKVMGVLGHHLGVKVVAYVGSHIDMDIISNGVHVVVGTPRSVLGMLLLPRIRKIDIKMVVLDKTDEMLFRRFRSEIYKIFDLLRSTKIQVSVSSATWPPWVLEVTRQIMKEPLICIHDELTLENIEQFYVNVKEKIRSKPETLYGLVKTIHITQGVIFVNSRCEADRLTNQMRSLCLDFTVSATHRGVNQYDRDVIMQKFRSGSLQVLITTDLLIRGIDVKQVSHVINYDLPTQPETYLHRIGRSTESLFGGRNKVVAINFVTRADHCKFIDIQKKFKVVMKELPAA